MPTHKLWIEHTERAAWQSVQALREKLAEAEQRENRLAPPAEGWRELFAGLEAARGEQKLAGETYAELLRGLLARLRNAEERVRALEQNAQQLPPVALASPERVRRSELRSRRVDADADWDGEDDSEAPVRGERRLGREIRSRYLSFVQERGGFDAGTVLADIQTRLEDLPALDAAEVFDAAADLGALSLVLARGGRGD
jgi:hypothetical protein